MLGLGFQVSTSDFGFRVSGLEFRSGGLGVEGFELQDGGVGFGVWGVGTTAPRPLLSHLRSG